MQLAYYPDNRLRIDSIASRLTATERLARNSVMEQIIDKGRPITAADLKQVEALRGLDVLEQLTKLTKKRTIVLNPEGFITFSYPVSALPTKHKVTLEDGRTFHAMCALDALGAAFTFHQDVVVDSECSKCRETVRIVISDKKITDLQPANTHVLHVDLNKYDNWSGSC